MVLAIILALIGAVFTANGILGLFGEQTVLHQLYVGLYIIGGLLLIGIAVLIEAVNQARRAFVKEAQIVKTALSQSGQLREREDALLQTIEKNTRKREGPAPLDPGGKG